MAKPVKTVVKIQIEAGKANPAPPVGTALGPHGVDMMAFCSAFNDQTKDRMGQIIPVEITIYEDRTIDFITKTPPAAFLIREKLRLDKGSGVPNRDKVGKLSEKQLTEIAEAKLVDLSANDIEGARKIIAGTARSMGVEVESE